MLQEVVAAGCNGSWTSPQGGTTDHLPVCTQVTAARRELVRELLRGRRSDLPLMLVWSCPRLSYGGKVHITIAALQLALGQGALTFSPCIRNKSLWTPEWESSRWMITGHPRVTLDPQQRTPDDVRWADPVRPYTASEASAEVRPTGRLRAMHPHQLCHLRVNLPMLHKAPKEESVGRVYFLGPEICAVSHNGTSPLKKIAHND